MADHVCIVRVDFQSVGVLFMFRKGYMNHQLVAAIGAGKVKKQIVAHLRNQFNTLVGKFSFAFPAGHGFFYVFDDFFQFVVIHLCKVSVAKVVVRHPLLRFHDAFVT